MKTPSATNRDDRPPIGQTGALTLTEDLLALANEHEQHAYHRYRWLSLRFLTYHIGISRLMQELAGERQQRVEALIEISASLKTRECLLQDPATAAWQGQQVRLHFFIFDDEVAAHELSRALLEEWQSRRFYKRLQAYNGIPDLDAWLEACVRQSQAQFRILQEAEDQLPSLPCRPHEVTR